MKKICLFLLITCMFAGNVFAYDVLVPADMSCRTDIGNFDTNHHDSSKLSIRSDASAAKSWIRFDISGLTDPNSIRGVTLRLTLHEDEGNYHFDVSAVNDDCLDNIGWDDRNLTWSNAPANDTADWYNPDFTKATLVGTVDLTDNYLAGSQHFIDVSDAFLADTDGIVQFILHNSDSLINCATHDHPNGEEYWPTLIFTYPPLGADYPLPEIGETLKASSVSTLSWVNPDPNDGVSSIYCDVYLGTEPNRLGMNMVSLGADVESVAISSFPALIGDPATMYYWYVDCHVGSPAGPVIEGEEWYFTVNDNSAPTVDAGTDQTVWLTDANSITLSGSVGDDGLPAAGTLTTSWAETAGPGTSVIADDSQTSTSVSFAERGDYTFTLTANDGDKQTSATVRVVVGDDVCDASHIETGDPYNDADANQDCIVDLQDFIDLIANDWLNCTDQITSCAP